MKEEDIKSLLKEVIDPQSGESIVIQSVELQQNRVIVTIALGKGRNPFVGSIKRAVLDVISKSYPEAEVSVIMKEVEAKPVDNTPKRPEQKIKNIIAVASGKGGVGKSTVACNLAVTLAKQGYKVGILDADIYGPSQPKMFAVEGAMPVAESVDGVDMIVPIESYGVKIMSIGFFIKPTDALIWRGAMATNALKQLIDQTLWGELDFLILDMPPGTGDVHLTLIQQLKISGAVIVSTPQQIALADVVRGISMFRADKVEIPVLGIVENMAWFTPMELPDNRYYIFGNGGAKALAEREGIAVLGQIPIIMSVMEGADDGTPVAATDGAIAEFYQQLTKNIINNLH